LSQQWIDELARHAPSLKVLVYPGWKGLSLEEKTKKKKSSKQKQEIQGNSKITETRDAFLGRWSAHINTFDVCITTYDTLRRDLNVARFAPNRPARETAEYSRDRRMISPLVACEWYRVIMDEVRSLHLMVWQIG
jgi:E3 ubiquitin-protein ligase SHPRH